MSFENVNNARSGAAVCCNFIGPATVCILAAVAVGLKNSYSSSVGFLCEVKQYNRFMLPISVTGSGKLLPVHTRWLGRREIKALLPC